MPRCGFWAFVGDSEVQVQLFWVLGLMGIVIYEAEG